MQRMKFYILGTIGVLIIITAAFLLNPRPSVDEELAPAEPVKIVREEKLLASRRKSVVTDKGLLHLKTRENPLYRGKVSATQEKVDALVMQLASEDDHESVNALMEAQDLRSSELLSFVQKALNLPGQREFRKEAFDLVLGYNRPDVLPLVQQAFSDHHKELRLAALEALEYIGNKEDDTSLAEEANELDEIEESASEEIVLNDQERVEILRILEDAFNDIDPEVRQQALASLLQMELSLQVDGFKLAQQSSYEDVRSNVMHVTGTSANWDTMEIAINALDDPNPDIQEVARGNIDFYIGKTFESSSEAREWWQNNKYLFDDDLFLEDLDNLHVLDD